MAPDDTIIVDLTVRDIREFLAELRLAQQGIRGVGSAGRSASIGLSGIGRTGVTRVMQGMRQEAFRLGAVMSTTTVGGIGAVATAIGVMGIKASASFEQYQIAFTSLLGSSGEADKLLDYLQKFAAKTPFEFPDLVKATQKMLAYGFTLEQIPGLLTSISNAASGLGAGADGIDRIQRALGQMQAKGRVQSQELLQLTEVGIPALQLLAAGFGVSTGEMQKAVSAGIVSSDKAIKYIQSGIDKKFGGLVEKQSKTLTGLFSTFKDNVRFAVRELTDPLVPGLKRQLNTVNSALPAMKKRLQDIMKVDIPQGVKAFKAGDAEGVARALAHAVGGGETFRRITTELVSISMHLGVIWSEEIWPGVEAVFGSNGGNFLSVLHSLDMVTGFLAAHTTTFKIAVIGLIATFLIYKTLMIAITLGEKAYVFWTGMATIRTVAWKNATNAQKIAIVAMTVATKLATAAVWLFNTSLLSNPIVRVILLLAALGAGLVWLYRHSARVRAAFGEIGRVAKIAFTPTLWLIDKIGDAFEWAWKHAKKLKDIVDAGGWMGKVGNFVSGLNPFGGGGGNGDLKGVLEKSGIDPNNVGGGASTAPKLRKGGTVQAAGSVVVGDGTGPELLNLPRGASVDPLPNMANPLNLDNFGWQGPDKIVLQVDRKVLAEVSLKEYASMKARKQ